MLIARQILMVKWYVAWVNVSGTSTATCSVPALIMAARCVMVMAPSIVALAIVPEINTAKCIVPKLLAAAQRVIVTVKLSVPGVVNRDISRIVFLEKNSLPQSRH